MFDDARLPRRAWLRASARQLLALAAVAGGAPADTTAGVQQTNQRSQTNQRGETAGGTNRSHPAAVPVPTKAAIRRGLVYLQSRQNEDGSFGRGGYGRNVAIVGLAGMAFLSHGSTPGRGEFGRNVDRCLRYVLAAVQENGLIATANDEGRGRMYGHGFATLFLAEAYGMSPDGQVRDKLRRAVRLIVESQNALGAWRYEPDSQDADISVTICQVMALRAARNAGLFVPNETIDRCIDYVKRSQNADGGFMYMQTQPGVSMFPRSAAGVVALHSAGIYEGDEVENGLAYLMQHVPRPEARDQDGHFFYGQYYAVQAMWQTGGERWNQWYAAVQETLLARQRNDGSWFDAIGSEYATAMACLVLQTPSSYLPIFQH